MRPFADLGTGQRLRSYSGVLQERDGRHLREHAARPLHPRQDRHPLRRHQHKRSNLLDAASHLRQVRRLTRPVASQ